MRIASVRVIWYPHQLPLYEEAGQTVAYPNNVIHKLDGILAYPIDGGVDCTDAIQSFLSRLNVAYE
jgi:hypothetical protein